MALFQRQPTTYNQNLSYTISVSKATILTVGLGNPGKKYEQTRHNVGFMAVDQFAKSNDFEKFQINKKLKGQISEKVMGSNRVILFKPETFMNLSGEAVRAVMSFYKIDLANIVVVYDELSLPFGQLRTRMGGQSAGHNGIKSLIEQVGSTFGRLRIGISNELAAKKDSGDFVLAKFTKEEQGNLTVILNEASSILTEYIYSGELADQTRQIDVRQ